jgi:hypothetical protein
MSPGPMSPGSSTPAAAPAIAVAPSAGPAPVAPAAATPTHLAPPSENGGQPAPRNVPGHGSGAHFPPSPAITESGPDVENAYVHGSAGTIDPERSGTGSVGLGHLARGLFTPAVVPPENGAHPTAPPENGGYRAAPPAHPAPQQAAPSAQSAFPTGPADYAGAPAEAHRERAAVPPPSQLYGAAPAAPGVNGSGAQEASMPEAAAPVRPAEPQEPFPIPARPQPRPAPREQAETDEPPAKATARRVAARTPRARKAVEPVTGEGAGMHGGDGSAA